MALTPSSVFEIFAKRDVHEDEQELLCMGLAVVRIEFALVQQGLRPPALDAAELTDVLCFVKPFA